MEFPSPWTEAGLSGGRDRLPEVNSRAANITGRQSDRSNNRSPDIGSGGVSGKGGKAHA
jgi:hypothetical protein